MNNYRDKMDNYLDIKQQQDKLNKAMSVRQKDKEAQLEYLDHFKEIKEKVEELNYKDKIEKEFGKSINTGYLIVNSDGSSFFNAGGNFLKYEVGYRYTIEDRPSYGEKGYHYVSNNSRGEIGTDKENLVTYITEYNARILKIAILGDKDFSYPCRTEDVEDECTNDMLVLKDITDEILETQTYADKEIEPEKDKKVQNKLDRLVVLDTVALLIALGCCFLLRFNTFVGQHYIVTIIGWVVAISIITMVAVTLIIIDKLVSNIE